jgi:hypothetical protein
MKGGCSETRLFAHRRLTLPPAHGLEVHEQQARLVFYRSAVSGTGALVTVKGPPVKIWEGLMQGVTENVSGHSVGQHNNCTLLKGTQSPAVSEAAKKTSCCHYLTWQSPWVGARGWQFPQCSIFLGWLPTGTPPRVCVHKRRTYSNFNAYLGGLKRLCDPHSTTRAPPLMSMKGMTSGDRCSPSPIPPPLPLPAPPSL